MYKKIFYLLTFILVGLVGCEKDETTEVSTQYSEENLRKFGALPMQTSSLCCSNDLPIILDIKSTPFSGTIGTYSCDYNIASADWIITNSNNNYLASGSGTKYSSLFLPTHDEVYTLSIEAVMTGSQGLSKIEVANFNFIYHKNGNFYPHGNTRTISFCDGLGGAISAFAP